MTALVLLEVFQQSKQLLGTPVAAPLSIDEMLKMTKNHAHQASPEGHLFDL